MKVLVTTVPFATADRTPLDLLEDAGIDYVINPLNRKLKQNELAEMIEDYDCLIAGIEYNKQYYQDRDIKPSEQIFFSLTFTQFTTISTPSF